MRQVHWWGSGSGTSTVRPRGPKCTGFRYLSPEDAQRFQGPVSNRPQGTGALHVGRSCSSGVRARGKARDAYTCANRSGVLSELRKDSETAGAVDCDMILDLPEFDSHRIPGPRPGMLGWFR